MSGTASRGDAPATQTNEVRVLFVHGQPGLGSDFEPVAEKLGPGFAVSAPDRPGYGSSLKPSVSMSENVDVLAGVLEQGGPVPAIVVGHSFGGGIALLLARRRPDLVCGLVLAASVGYLGELGNVDRLLAVPVVGDVLVAGGLGAAGRILPLLRAPAKWVPGRMGKWMSVSLPDGSFTKVAVRRPGVWRSVVAEQRALIDEIPSVEDALPEIDVPTEVVAGTWDIIVAPEVAARIASSIRGAELVLVPVTGHFLTRDAPWVLAAAIRRVAVRAGLLDPETPEN
jgi:pimeloyl-ACP methyl ester carboxylesterase